uniref:3'-5' exonuclease domain-containing protein n=1 Tax=Ditylenchus dipsaci TaxID=166011 RepID=A0A915EGL1_9BILA
MQIAVHYFLALLDAVPKYMEQNKDLKEWRSKTDLNVLQILIQSFLSWLPYKNQQHRILLKQAKEAAKLEQEKMEKEKQEELQKLGVATDVTEAKLMDSTSELKLDKAETQQDNNQKYNYPKKDDTHILSLDLRQKLLKQLISVDFPVGIHIWKNILSALEWHDDKMAILADLVVQAVEQGQASYCLLHYCIARHNAAILFTDPSLILVTLLLGPITANMVEIFANNRDDEFRAKVRGMLLEAESLTKNEQAYMELSTNIPQKS